MMLSSARFVDVDDVDRKKRGQALHDRRLALGIKSVNELYKQSGISRDAITAAEAGSASVATYERLEAWFARFEEETGSDEPAAPEIAMMEIEVSGDFGVKIVVRGPITDREALEQSARRIIRSIREDEDGLTPSG
jgi:hypothetical protein